MKQVRRRISRPRYNLKNPNGKESTLILLVYRYNPHKKFVYSTGKKVHPKYWKEGQAKENLKNPTHRELNIFLGELLVHVQKIVSSEPTISTEDLKKRLDKWQGLGGKEEYIPLFTEYMKIKIRKSEKDYRTIQKYKTTWNKLNEYSEERGVTLTFEAITIDWKNDFVNYLRSSAKKGVSDNTLNKHIQIVAKFMKEAQRERIAINGILQPYHDNSQYLYPEFKVKRVKTTKHFLELSELKQLIRYEPKSESHQIVKDYWLLMAFTGLRVSDVRKLSIKHIQLNDGMSVIRMNTFKGRNTKADNEVVIPLLDEANKILVKYDFQMPEPLSEQKHNTYIKTIIDNAEINRLVLNKQNVNGEQKEEQVKLSSKITNHSARYSFINFMLNDYQISPLQLTKITGQSLDVLMGYERGDKKKNAVQVLKTIQSKQLKVLK